LSKKLEDMNRQELIDYVGKLHDALEGMIRSTIEASKLLNKDEELKEIIGLVKKYA